MKKWIITFSIALILTIAGGAYYLGVKSTAKDLEAAQAAVIAASAPRVGDATTTPVTPSAVVHITKGAFDPMTVTVKKGEEVIWMNTDAVAHTVTSDEGGIVLNSQSIAAGHSYAHIFANAETVTYHCAIDRAMTGKVIVEN